MSETEKVGFEKAKQRKNDKNLILGLRFVQSHQNMCCVYICARSRGYPEDRSNGIEKSQIH